MGMGLNAVIELQVDDGALVKRVENRAAEAAAAGQPVRADDNAESLKTRLMEYYKKTAPLIGYYYARGELQSVDGMREIETVGADINAILDRVS